MLKKIQPQVKNQAQPNNQTQVQVKAYVNSKGNLESTIQPAQMSSCTERAFTALRYADLFSILPELALRKIAAMMIEKNYPAGTTLFRSGENSTGNLSLIAEGAVSISVESQEQKETVLATLAKCEIFGEMSLLDDAPHSAIVKTVFATRVLILTKEDARRVLKEFPVLLNSLLVEMVRRLRSCNRKVVGISYRPMQERVASAMVGLVEDRGVRQREGGSLRVYIRNRPTQQFLAEMAGTTRESVSRTLAIWGREGWLKTEGRNFVLFEEDRLRQMAA